MTLQFGGAVGRNVLAKLARRFSPGEIDWDELESDSGLRRYFGDTWLEQMRGKRYIDWGCGRGADVVAAAVAGASLAVGVDIQEYRLEFGRRLAEQHGVASRCRFINAQTEPDAYAALDGGFDFASSVDAFEHFDDPHVLLHEVHRLLAPGGTFLLSFGPPWRHPFGAHLSGWITLPWIHFLFDEPTVLAVRSGYIDDGATRYEHVVGGLNKMTIARCERLLAQSDFRVTSFEPVPIRPLRLLQRVRALREYTTSMVRVVCTRAQSVS